MGYKDVDEYLETIPPHDPETDDRTGFWQNFSPMLDVFTGEDLSNSRYRNNAEEQYYRNKVLKGMFRQGFISQEEWNSFKRVNTLGGASMPRSYNQMPGNMIDFSSMAEYVQKRGAAPDGLEAAYDYQRSIPTDEQIQEKTRETLKIQRKEQQEIAMKADNWGYAGMAAGVLAGAAQDPLNYIPLPATWFRWARAMGIGGRILANALEGAATEALIQPIVYSWKDDIDSPYTAEDAALNILAGFGFGAAVTTVGEVAIGTSQMLNRMRKARNAADLHPDEQAVVDTLKDMERELKSHPRQDETFVNHARKTAQIEDEINEAPPAVSQKFDDEPHLDDEWSAEDDIQVQQDFTEILEMDPDITVKLDNGAEVKATDAVIGEELEVEKLKTLRECIIG